MTPEEWADKARAEILARVAEHVTGTLAVVNLGDGEVEYTRVDDEFREVIASVVRSAVAEALNSGMPGLPLTDEELAQIAAREAAEGLHGPFCHGQSHCHNVYSNEGVDVTAPCGGLSAPDAEFVAHAREDVKALLAHVAHASALFRDMAGHADNATEIYRLGYEAGRKDAAAADVLRSLEWSGPDDGWGPTCPACESTRRSGHKTGCRLVRGAGIKKVTVPFPTQPGDFAPGTT